MPDKYKIRIFYKEILHDNGIMGAVKIRKGSKDFILETIKTELGKSRKIIIDLI